MYNIGLYIIAIIIITLLIIFIYVDNSYNTIEERMVSQIKKTAHEKTSNKWSYTSDDLFSHLCYIDDLLTKHEIKHWVMYGTLLGGIRQKNIIEYDYDIDFGASINDADKLLSLNGDIESDGYYLKKGIATMANMLDLEDKTKYKDMWKVSLKIMYKDVEVGDIYLYDNFSDGLTRRFNIKELNYFMPKCTFPTWFIDELEQVQIRGKFFDCPRDAKILLEHWYGKRWQTPVKAVAQGGESDSESDYYGSMRDLKLSFLTDYLYNTYGIRIVPNLMTKFDYIFYDKEELNWLYINDIPKY